MNKCILYGHGGSYNHGAEAITSTTIKLLKEVDNNISILLSTHFKEQDMIYLRDVDAYLERDMEYWDLAKKAEASSKYNALVYKSTLDAIDENSLCLSIGGDNYCYDNWSKWKIINEHIKSQNAKSVLWSCSVEPSMINNDMVENLNNHDIIAVRESITYDALKKKGVKTDIYIVPDVAFLLEPKKVILPYNFKANDTLGINISPLTMRCSKDESVYKNAFIDAINYLLKNTEMNIALIPHVLMPNDNDYNLLKEIYDSISDKEKVVLISGDYSANEYKYIISKCRFFIGARTHSTIAAYSTCVPTLAIGYSVKAHGIAADVMGKVEDYVIAANIIDSDTLIGLIKRMISREENDREHLHIIIDKYKNDAKINYDMILRKLLN